ncbi:hypothetical protein ACHAXM_008015 [Skeletonema potamos]
MSGSPASRYAFEEELNLASPPHDPFAIPDEDYDSDEYENRHHAPESDDHEYGERTTYSNSNKKGPRRSRIELWKDDTRQFNKNGQNFEMVPLSDSSNHDDGDHDNYFDYDSDDNENGDDGQVRPSHYSNFYSSSPSSSAAASDGLCSGDDYDTSNTYLSKRLYHYLYPPNVPREVQLLRKENIAVPACYLLVGLLQGLSGPFTNVYPLDLNASEAQQTTISSLKSLPSTFKLAFGFFSDNVPLAGYKRKSYMLVGWAIASLSMIALLTFSDLSAEAIAMSNASQQEEEMMNEDGSSGRYLLRQLQSSTAEFGEQTKIVGTPPSISFLSFSLLMFGSGFWLADVMGDSLVAEKAKLEPESSRGHLQSTCYACRFFGLMIAAPLSTVIYSKYGPQSVVILMAALPSLILPLIYNLKEKKDVPVASTRDQCREIWSTVCSRAVWQPMGFVYLYNVLQVGNAAWKQFLKTVLNFTSNQLNSLLIVAYVLLWLGIMAYKKFFITWSWRSVYVSTTLLNGVFSALQILLIKGITFGLSPFLFALGDDAFADFIGGIQFLPTTIMMVHLCPTGSEGASYAMFTTMSNSAYSLASAFSTLLLGVWDVSKEAMERGELTGMINLTALTTLIQVSGVLFVGLLPRTKEDLANLHSDPMSGSKIGGFIFLFVTLASVLYSIVVGVLNIVAPGWSGES